MNGYIYLITNILNDKKYVGSTTRSVKERWAEHKRDINKFDRPLYRAFRKYGIDNFFISTIEETNDLVNREIHFIEEYDTYKNGYNATLGGEGRKSPNATDLEVLKSFKITNNAAESARILSTCATRISKILKDNEVSTDTQNKAIYVPELDMTFKSTIECGQFLLDNDFTTNKYCSRKIYDVIAGTRKSYLEMTFMVLVAQ